MKPTDSLRDIEQERVVPWGSPQQYAWHEARYRFALSLARGARVLDVGSGEGYGPAILAAEAAHVVGVDYSPAAVEHARTKYVGNNLEFMETDVRRLAFPAGSFDLVTCFEVLEHIDDQAALLEGIRGGLVPAGTLLLSCPNAELENLYERVTGREHYAYHVNVVDYQALRQLLKQHFATVEFFGQFTRGNRLRMVLKMIDRYNIRHRIVRSRRLQAKIGARVMGTAYETGSPDDVQFSRLMAKQSPIVLARARCPRPI
ncbi:MAG TPA: class I SAM-dependent methyltransferase [Solirubrobacteraceae bacterium]|jgi:2-polyprenyl-3-methyl-5-hydroxy-6-metoxy-1,4-benzoquinol methylase|nr:class I SAM-dependent methyltransferase [Solirubrobacteraceae bacterium]